MGRFLRAREWPALGALAAMAGAIIALVALMLALGASSPPPAPAQSGCGNVNGDHNDVTVHCTLSDAEPSNPVTAAPQLDDGLDLLQLKASARWETSNGPLSFHEPRPNAEADGYAMTTYAAFEDGRTYPKALLIASPYGEDAWTRGDFTLDRPIGTGEVLSLTVGSYEGEEMPQGSFRAECLGGRIKDPLVLLEGTDHGGDGAFENVNIPLDKCTGSRKLRLTSLAKGGYSAALVWARVRVIR